MTYAFISMITWPRGRLHIKADKNATNDMTPLSLITPLSSRDLVHVAGGVDDPLPKGGWIAPTSQVTKV